MGDPSLPVQIRPTDVAFSSGPMRMRRRRHRVVPPVQRLEDMEARRTEATQRTISQVVENGVETVATTRVGALVAIDRQERHANAVSVVKRAIRKPNVLNDLKLPDELVSALCTFRCI